MIGPSRPHHPTGDAGALRGRRAMASSIPVMAAALLLPSMAWASFVSSGDLFLSPAVIPFAVYDPITISPGDSVTFSASEVPGATQLVALHILPILNPDPSTDQGAYTLADLAAINVSNYSSSYAFQPNADYFATTITGNSSIATFDASGPYYVDLQTSDGISTKDSFFRIEANDFLLEDPGAGVKDATAADRMITLPVTDLTIISDGDPNDKGALADAAKQFPNAPRAKTIADVVKDISDYYNAHGKKKFEVTIIGHGRPGSIKIGTQRINNAGDSNMTPADFQKLIDPYVSSVHFASCNTAAGDAGAQFLKDINASIKLTTGYDSYLTVTDTYFDIGATGKLVTLSDVPEPGAWALILLGSGLVGATLRRRGSRNELATTTLDATIRSN